MTYVFAWQVYLWGMKEIPEGIMDEMLEHVAGNA